MQTGPHHHKHPPPESRSRPCLWLNRPVRAAPCANSPLPAVPSTLTAAPAAAFVLSNIGLSRPRPSPCARSALARRSVCARPAVRRICHLGDPRCLTGARRPPPCTRSLVTSRTIKKKVRQLGNVQGASDVSRRVPILRGARRRGGRLAAGPPGSVPRCARPLSLQVVSSSFSSPPPVSVAGAGPPARVVEYVSRPRV